MRESETDASRQKADVTRFLLKGLSYPIPPGVTDWFFESGGLIWGPRPPGWSSGSVGLFPGRWCPSQRPRKISIISDSRSFFKKSEKVFWCLTQNCAVAARSGGHCWPLAPRCYVHVFSQFNAPAQTPRSEHARTTQDKAHTHIFFSRHRARHTHSTQTL